MQPEERNHETTASRFLNTLAVCIVTPISVFVVVAALQALLEPVLPKGVSSNVWRYIASGTFLAAAIWVSWYVSRTRHRIYTKVPMIAFFVPLNLLFSIGMLYSDQ